MKQIIAVLLSLFGLTLSTDSVLAAPMLTVIITENNQDQFWNVTNSANKVVACYKKDVRILPGKRTPGVSGGVAVDFWKDTYRKKIQKLKKAKKDTKKAKKAFRVAKKLCQDNEPVPTPTPTPTPTPIPTPQIECGNGLLEAAEICDDGNAISGDGCSAACANERCGDGILQTSLGEECDDGNAVLGDGCSASCSIEGPVLVPGTGFSGATTEPGPVGDPLAGSYSAKAIARWNVVPYQTFYSEVSVGVVAFHISGIDRVEISVNGGAWNSLQDMTLNPDSGTIEYWAKLKGTDFADGVVELRAIAYPNSGQPRLLEPLYLNANLNGTLQNKVRYVSATAGNDETGDGSIVYPYATILKALKVIQDANGNSKADGGSVYLLAGNYTLGGYSPSVDVTTSDRWITVRPAPGVLRSDVIINSVDEAGLKTKLVKLEEVTITAELKSDAAMEDHLWIYNCTLQGLGRDTVVGDNGFVSNSSGWTDYFVTDSTIQDHKDGIPAKLVRNVTLNNLGSDAFSGAQMVINSTVNVINAAGTLYNPDLFEFDFSAGNIENRIYYGIKGFDVGANGFSANGAGVATLKDVAFVNILHDFAPYEFITSGSIQALTMNHILFWHVTSIQDLSWGVAGANLSNVSLRNSVFLGFDNFGDATTSVLDNQDVYENHFMNSDILHFVPGVNSTTGAPDFVNAAANNYNLNLTSPLKDRSSSVVVAGDINQNYRTGLVSVGAYE